MYFSFRNLSLAAVAALSAATGLSGCGTVPDRSQEATVFVLATATANEPGAQIPAGFEQVLRDANSTHRGSLSVLMPRAGRVETVGDHVPVAVTRGGTDPENDPDLIEAGLQRISEDVVRRLNAVASNDTVLDLLVGLDDAARRAPRATIVAVSSGLQTAGPADFVGLGWDFSNTTVVDDLRAKGFLPDLTGKKVTFVGLGDTAGGAQAPLPTPMRAKVESFWMDLCRAAGADQCATDRPVSTVPTASTTPAKVVAVPSFSVPALPAGDGSVPIPSEALFAPDSTDLLAQAQAPLAALTTQLMARNATVDLVGHTWTVGPSDTARTLSEKRARVVADALIGYGLPADRIGSVTGVGFDELIHPAGADELATAAANRVVVVTVRTGR